VTVKGTGFSLFINHFFMRDKDLNMDTVCTISLLSQIAEITATPSAPACKTILAFVQFIPPIATMGKLGCNLEACCKKFVPHGGCASLLDVVAKIGPIPT